VPCIPSNKKLNMGCDIHTYIEYRHRKGSAWADGRWFSWGTKEIYLGRDYRLFAALSGQRKDIGFEELIPERGIPRDAGSVVFNEHHSLIVEDEHHVPGALGKTDYVLRSNVRLDGIVVKRGGAEYVEAVSFSACHGHSYLTLEEIHQCLAHAGLELEKTMFFFQVTVATMEKLAETYETRLVFWYDF